MNTAKCKYCGKRLAVLDRARPSLHRHICVNGHSSRGAILDGSVQWKDKVPA